MSFSPPIIAVGIAILFFYIRMAQLRGQNKRIKNEYALKRRKVGGRSKGAALPTDPPGTPPYAITSWWLVALAMLLMLFGVGLYTLMFPQLVQYSQYWYIPVCLGTVIFAFCFKVKKPILNEGS
jgi:hypothetical protein